MGTYTKLEGGVLELFKSRLTWMRDELLANQALISELGARAKTLNPMHLLGDDGYGLGGYYDRFEAENGIISSMTLLGSEQLDGDSRIEALLWLAEWLKEESNLLALAEAGPVSMVLVEPSENDGDYFMFHNWVGPDRFPNFDYSLGPNNGVSFTS